jgi:hypothetical protein
VRKIFFVAILFTYSCSDHTDLSTDEKQNIVLDIERTMSLYNKDVSAGGLTAEFKYLDSSADFFWVPPGYSSAISYDSVATILRQNAPQFISVNNTLDFLKVIPIKKRFAAYTARINSVMKDTSGKTTRYSLIETGIFIKRKDGWKLLSGQTSIIHTTEVR